MYKDILVIGSPIYSYTESVSNAFSQIGLNSKFRVYKIPNRIFKHLPILSTIYNFYYLKIYPNSIYRFCLKKAPQNGILLFFGINYLGNKKLTILKKKFNLKVILWFIDSIYTFSCFERNIEVADYIFCYNKSEAEALTARGKRAFFLAMAYDPLFYYPKFEIKKKYDLYFIGTLSSRLEFLNTLLYSLEHLKLSIRIDGPVSYFRRIKIKKSFPLLNKYLSGKAANHKDINDLYNQSKICLGLQPLQADSGLSTRTYEICGSASLQITNGNKNILNDIFEIGKEVLHFEKETELIAIIENVLTNWNQEEINKIALAGYKRATTQHTFKHRAEEILSRII